jgi:hypothetical protein
MYVTGCSDFIMKRVGQSYLTEQRSPGPPPPTVNRFSLYHRRYFSIVAHPEETGVLVSNPSFVDRTWNDASGSVRLHRLQITAFIGSGQVDHQVPVLLSVHCVPLLPERYALPEA